MIPKEQMRSIYVAVLPAFMLALSFREAFRFAGAVTTLYLLGALLVRVLWKKLSYAALQKMVIGYVALASLVANAVFHVSPIIFVSVWALFFSLAGSSSFELYGVPPGERPIRLAAYRMSTISTTATAFLSLFLLLVMTAQGFKNFGPSLLAVFFLAQIFVFEVVVQFWNQFHFSRSEETD